jgi:hypothetical protein
MTDTGLAANTSYYYQVRFNATTTSNLSNQASTTAVATPGR